MHEAGQGLLRAALVRYESRAVPILEPDGAGGLRQVDVRTPNAYLLGGGPWQLVDWDDDGMLFLEQPGPEWGEPYRFVQPEDAAWTLRQAATNPAFRAGALAEVERKLAELPGSRRAAELAARLRALPEGGRAAAGEALRRPDGRRRAREGRRVAAPVAGVPE